MHRFKSAQKFSIPLCEPDRQHSAADERLVNFAVTAFAAQLLERALLHRKPDSICYSNGWRRFCLVLWAATAPGPKAPPRIRQIIEPVEGGAVQKRPLLERHGWIAEQYPGAPDIRVIGERLGRKTASPSVNDLPPPVSKIALNICWFNNSCPPGPVIPDDAHTAIAPPRSAFINDSARLSSTASWK